MNPYALGSIVGAIIITFLLTRLALWLGRDRIKDTTGVVIAYAIVLALVFVVAGFGFADGAGFRADAVLVYVLPLLFWLAIDLYRRRVAPKPPA